MRNKHIAPQAKKIEKRLERHGDLRIDNYYWMNQRDSEDVLAHLKAENAYCESMLKHTEPFQKELYKEMLGRIKKTDQSVPYFKNGYYYYTRTEGDDEYAIYCRKKESLEAEEEIILNVPEMAKDYRFYELGDMAISPDNKFLAFSVDTSSRRLYTIQIKNLSTGEILNERIENTSGEMCWDSNSETIFYTKLDTETLLPFQVWKHLKSSSVEKDTLIYEEKDNTFYTSVYKSKSGKYIIIFLSSTLSCEYRILEADNPNGEFRIFQKRQREHEYYISHYEDYFYVMSNENALNFKLLRTPINNTEQNNWELVLEHREDVLIESVEVFHNYFVIEERVKGLTQLRLIHHETKEDYYIPFDEEVYSVWLSINPEFKTDLLRIGYNSLTTPATTLEYNVNTKERKVLKQQEVLGDFDSNNYKSERVLVETEDKREVPVSLVYHKDTVLSEKTPLLLYGYGAYGSSMDPYFSSIRLSLLNRGFVFAIAHVRGGEELGRIWYDEGKMEHKQNTFKDFIACAEFLIENKYSSSGKLFAMGGSAGGLLMGAVLNMRPDLWKGVVAQVPFVDALTTMLDESIPLTAGEYDEWGNPNEKEAYDCIKAYSPYDNVRELNYPAILVTTGYNDSQVQYWEPAKWVAKLRDKNQSENSILFKTEMDFGHGGASGRFEALKEAALEYAFILDQLGICE